MKYLSLFVLIYFFTSPVLAATAYEKELLKREKIKQKAEMEKQKFKTKLAEKKLKDQARRTKEIEREIRKIEKEREEFERREEKERKKSIAKAEKLAEKVAKKSKQEAKETIVLSEEVEEEKETKKSKDDIEALRAELRANEEKALEFIFPSIEDSKFDVTRENFFSKTEKEQLLELWRATLARNRTIQFIIKSLSTNPNDIEKNNAVMQVLSRALFVPFYAVSSVTNNALISGGSAVGARVIGDVVNAKNDQRSRTREVTRTDLIVLFMLVDEVAERLRRSYYAYKDAKIEQELIDYELKAAHLDAAEAMEKNEKTSIFFTRMVVRDLERRTRSTKLKHMTNRRTLVELAGAEAVDSVDLLINLEVEEMMSDIIRV